MDKTAKNTRKIICFDHRIKVADPDPGDIFCICNPDVNQIEYVKTLNFALQESPAVRRIATATVELTTTSARNFAIVRLTV